MAQHATDDPPLPPAEAPLDKHPSRGAGEENDHNFVNCDDDYAKAPKFIDLREVTLIVTEGVKNLGAANMQRVATLNSAPLKKVEHAPPKYQEEGLPPLLHHPAGYHDERGFK